MGHPKKSRRMYERPKRPYDKERISREKKLLNEFGLRRKSEIWRAESVLRDYRRRAR
jgi:small subunit ribosomal protein S4